MSKYPLLKVKNAETGPAPENAKKKIETEDAKAEDSTVARGWRRLVGRLKQWRPVKSKTVK